MGCCPNRPSGLVKGVSAMLISIGIRTAMRVAGRNVSKLFGNDGNVTRLGDADNPKRLPKMFR
jgi:hypothetical protein